MVTFGSNYNIRERRWTSFKNELNTRLSSLQHEEDNDGYRLYFIDGPDIFTCVLYKGTVPDGIAINYSQGENDEDKSDFLTNYLLLSNLPNISTVRVRPHATDDSVVRRFGNITTSGTSEVLVSGRAYVEQASQAQRSIKSTSASDADPGGSGARAVRITFLNSNYELKTEDILLNGTNAVNTVATDIRFIEHMEVIRGTSAVGAIQLMTTTGGGGSEFCGIGSGTTCTFMCHHYVPDGKTCYVIGWGGVTDDETTLKLVGQSRHDPNFLVDPTVPDIEKLFAGNPTAPNRLFFERFFKGGVKLDPKIHIRVTTTPNQNTNTVTRTWLYFWEE